MVWIVLTQKPLAENESFPLSPKIKLFELATTKVTCDNAFNVLFCHRHDGLAMRTETTDEFLVFEKVLLALCDASLWFCTSKNSENATGVTHTRKTGTLYAFDTDPTSWKEIALKFTCGMQSE